MSKKYTPYKGHFDIEPMLDEAERENIAFVVAVSRDDQRGAGKTYSTARALWKRYEEKGDRFMIFVREVNELGRQAEGCFGGFIKKEHPEYTIYEKSIENVFSIIYRVKGGGKDKKEECIGYCAILKQAQKYKNYRGIWERSNVKAFWMDEFMPINSKYLPNETRLMKTIIDSVNGEIIYMPIILTANCISIGNPWFRMLNLSGHIQSDTHRYKNNKCIYENVEVEGLTEKHITSAINIAFGDDDEEYLSNIWIADNNSLVEKPDGWGRPTYICGIIYDKTTYGLYYYPQAGYYYVSTNYDKTCDYLYNLTLNGDLNIPLLRTNRTMIRLRDWLYSGLVRVQHGGIQRMLLDVFS